jgi:hypothetical protein
MKMLSPYIVFGSVCLLALSGCRSGPKPEEQTNQQQEEQKAAEKQRESFFKTSPPPLSKPQ